METILILNVVGLIIVGACLAIGTLIYLSIQKDKRELLKQESFKQRLDDSKLKTIENSDEIVFISENGEEYHFKKYSSEN